MKIFYKILIFLMLVIFFQSLISLTLYQFRLGFPTLSLLDKYLIEQVDIIYFGDSTNGYVDSKDVDKRTLSEMIKDNLPNLSLGSLDYSAYQMNLYAAYFRYINKQSYTPKLIIIPINMRSFAPAWDQDPVYQFDFEQNFLDRWFLYFLIDRPLNVFRHKTTQTNQIKFENTPVFNGIEQVGKVKDFININYYKHPEENPKKEVFNYMYLLTRDHQKIKSMIDIAERSKDGPKVLFYISPVNYYLGEKYLPNQFEKRLGENINLIRAVLLEKNAEVLDLSHALKYNDFVGGGAVDPDDHFNEHGKRYIANKLSKQVVNILKIQ